jgi:hypothetical protein
MFQPVLRNVRSARRVSEQTDKKKEQVRADSLQKVLQTTKQDTTRVNTLNTLASDLLKTSKADSAIALSSSALNLSKKINFTRGEADSYFTLGQAYAGKTRANDALSNSDLY